MKKLVYFIVIITCAIFIANGCEKLNIDEPQNNYTEKDLAGLWHLVQEDTFYWDAKYDDYGRESVTMIDDENYCWEFRGGELIVHYTEWEWNPNEWKSESIQKIAKYGYYIENNTIFVDDYQQPNEYVIEKVEGNNLWLAWYYNKAIKPFPKDGSEDEVVYKYRYQNKTVYRFRIKGTELDADKMYPLDYWNWVD